ncbi:hypothetical protein Goshw_027570 [Gossypium schwendimanii]|uniref:Uncharacterized protein n=1 Tax=Gossypium schwendimanii TaxID=34291 RepID=A0A7J9LS53_GOSSC|nr:hypothetical protein [Gossypium schwendimanii]
MCPDFNNELTVTSYMCFLDSLIDGAEDDEFGWAVRLLAVSVKIAVAVRLDTVAIL